MLVVGGRLCYPNSLGPAQQWRQNKNHKHAEATEEGKVKGKMVTHSPISTKHKPEGNNKTIVKGKACWPNGGLYFYKYATMEEVEDGQCGSQRYQGKVSLAALPCLYSQRQARWRCQCLHFQQRPLPTPTPTAAFKAPLPTVDDNGEVGGKSF